MPRLTARSTRGDERGVTMILVCVLVVTLLAMGAMVLDVGAMLQNKRELQNGADAAALAVAQSCALGEAACSGPPAYTLATSFAGFNAQGGTPTVESVAVDSVNHRVVVRTSKPVQFGLGRAVTGQSAKVVRAVATSGWGSLLSATTLPLTMSECEFDKVVFGATTVIFHTSTNGTSGGAQSCATSGGKDVAGGFGWFDQTTGGNCSATVAAGSTVSVDTGTSAPKKCDLSKLIGQTILVPIFNLVTGTGTSATYKITGFAAFVLTGYRFPSGGTAGNPVPCKSPSTCIGGMFIRYVADPGPIGGSDLGVSVVRLIG